MKYNYLCYHIIINSLYFSDANFSLQKLYKVLRGEKLSRTIGFVWDHMHFPASNLMTAWI